MLFRADMRYAGQDHTITVPLEPGWLDDHDALLAGARERFVAAHTQLYGHGTLDPPLEIVTSRARAVGRVARPPLPEAPRPADTGPVAHRQCVLPRGRPRRDAGLRARPRSTAAEGPAIVEEWTTTVVVPPGWSARADRLGNLLLERSR